MRVISVSENAETNAVHVLPEHCLRGDTWISLAFPLVLPHPKCSGKPLRKIPPNTNTFPNCRVGGIPSWHMSKPILPHSVFPPKKGSTFRGGLFGIPQLFAAKSLVYLQACTKPLNRCEPCTWQRCPMSFRPPEASTASKLLSRKVSVADDGRAWIFFPRLFGVANQV